MVLNIYPLEQSLRKLAGMFGSISSNREHIVVFITMLKSLRFTFDHEELVSVFISKGLAAFSPYVNCIIDLPLRRLLLTDRPGNGHASLPVSLPRGELDVGSLL